MNRASFFFLALFAPLLVPADELINQPPDGPLPPKPYADGSGDCCDCSEGTETGNDCVSFSQRFGRTPLVAGAPIGRIRVLEFTSARLPTGPDVVLFDHPLMRRIVDLDESRSMVTVDSADGWTVVYRGGRPSGWTTGADLAIRKDPVTGLYVEQLSDRTLVFYNADNAVDHVITPAGVRLDRSNWQMDVVYSGHAICQVWSAADGLMEVTRLGRGKFSVAWYPPANVSPGRVDGEHAHSGSPAKTFTFEYSRAGGLHRYRLSERRDARFHFEYLWTSRDGRDWTLVRDPDGLSLSDSKSSTVASGVRRTVRTYSAPNAPVRRELTYESVGLNGSTVTGRGWIEVDGSERLSYSATRIESGPAEGRLSETVNRHGGHSAFSYDGFGRLSSSSNIVFGSLSEVTTNVYAAALSDGFVDRRVRRTVVRRDGVVVSDTSWGYDDQNPSGRVETVVRRDPASGAERVSSTSCYPVDSANAAERGRVRLRVGEDGTATLYEYAEAAGAAYVRTATRGAMLDGVFEIIPSKSTRTVETVGPRGDVVRREEQVHVGTGWAVSGWTEYDYNLTHKRTGWRDHKGGEETSEWICTGPVWQRLADGSVVSNEFDAAKRLVASTRYGPFGAVRTDYALDPEGRVVAMSRSAAGLPALNMATVYDGDGRVLSETDEQGLTTAYSYSDDGRTTTMTLPGGGTRVTTLNPDGSTASVSGTAATPECRTYGVSANGLSWSCTRFLSPDCARWVRTFANGFGERTREERPGANGSTLTTEHAYNGKGQLVSTTATGRPTETRAYDELGNLAAVTRSADGASRVQTSETSYAVVDGEAWRVESSVLSCSDAAIAPLVATNMTQLSGLSPSNESHGVSIDVRGNATETWTSFDRASSTRTTWRRVPEAANAALSVAVDGVTVLSVSHSAVTNSFAYDAYRRETVRTDGRGNATTNAYDSLGRLASATDPTGATTSYAYDAAGRLAAVTNAIGVATVYEYDVRGNKTYEGGGTYPVSYAYDAFNVMTNMTTFRNEAVGRADPSAPQGDTTTWIYDEATGHLIQKLYADGKGPAYTYTDSGNLATRTWARGVVTTYAYDGWNSLTNMAYSDGTPTISLAYDALGRQTEAHDAAGVTTFLYDDFGAVTNETVIGVAGTNTIIRHWDNFGRSLGYSLVGLAVPSEPNRQSTLAYDPATGRLASMQIPSEQSNNLDNQTIRQFSWNYLPGSDLKSSLAYPNGLTASWTYDANNQLLQVCNAFPTNIISQYDYTYDAAGRRVEITRSGSAMSENRTDVYGYNARSELISAAKSRGSQSSATEYAYSYDDIGNRITSLDLGTNRTYTANNLNQCTLVGRGDPTAPQEEFTPQFDLDGNQALIKTSTGIWSVTYNGENRPVMWSCGTTNITMKFDRMGRRVEYLETAGGPGAVPATTNAHHRFVYNGYLCVQRLDAANGNDVNLLVVWDPTEPVATRPLFTLNPGGHAFFCTHDGNKNVSEVFFFQQAYGVAAHYEYAPFGAVTASTRNTSVTSIDARTFNPFRFSSEYADDTLGLVYYNYRHYEAQSGIWVARDLLPDTHEFRFCRNTPVQLFDALGNAPIINTNAINCLGFALGENAFVSPGDLSIDQLMKDYGYECNESKDGSCDCDDKTDKVVFVYVYITSRVAAFDVAKKSIAELFGDPWYLERYWGGRGVKIMDYHALTRKCCKGKPEGNWSCVPKAFLDKQEGLSNVTYHNSSLYFSDDGKTYSPNVITGMCCKKRNSM